MRVLQVENGNFTSLVFTINSGMCREELKCYSQMAEMLSEKRDEPYSYTLYMYRHE